MTTNPFYNALFAISYIVTLVSAIFLGANLIEDMQIEESIFMPMSALALLVLSVALMAYLFFYQPILMLLDGKRKEGVDLFLKTVGIFAVATACVMLTALIIGASGITSLQLD